MTVRFPRKDYMCIPILDALWTRLHEENTRKEVEKLQAEWQEGQKLKEQKEKNTRNPKYEDEAGESRKRSRSTSKDTSKEEAEEEQKRARNERSVSRELKKYAEGGVGRKEEVWSSFGTGHYYEGRDLRKEHPRTKFTETEFVQYKDAGDYKLEKGLSFTAAFCHAQPPTLNCPPEPTGVVRGSEYYALSFISGCVLHVYTLFRIQNSVRGSLGPTKDATCRANVGGAATTSVAV